MTAAGAAAMGRAFIESQMTSTCRIFTAGEPVTDPTTGEVTYAEQGAITAPCRVRPAGVAGNSGGNGQDIGGSEAIPVGFVVSVPFAVAPSKLQRLVITASPDPTLVGRSFEIRDVPRGDTITARRLLCEEVA